MIRCVCSWSFANRRTWLNDATRSLMEWVWSDERAKPCLLPRGSKGSHHTTVTSMFSLLLHRREGSQVIFGGSPSLMFLCALVSPSAMLQSLRDILRDCRRSWSLICKPTLSQAIMQHLECHFEHIIDCFALTLGMSIYHGSCCFLMHV